MNDIFAITKSNSVYHIRNHIAGGFKVKKICPVENELDKQEFDLQIVIKENQMVHIIKIDDLIKNMQGSNLKYMVEREKFKTTSPIVSAFSVGHVKQTF